MFDDMIAAVVVVLSNHNDNDTLMFAGDNIKTFCTQFSFEIVCPAYYEATHSNKVSCILVATRYVFSWLLLPSP